MSETAATIRRAITDRIKWLYLRETEGLPKAPSQRQWAMAHGLDPAKYNAWWNGTEPGYEGLLDLEKRFGIPWQWFLVGDAGATVIRESSADRKTHDDRINRERQAAIGTAHLQARRPDRKSRAG